jgi:GNAT superfamily N-acetyltransferase
VKVREARESDASAIGRAFVDSHHAAHRDHIPPELLAQRTYEVSSRNWARALREISAAAPTPMCIYVAEDDTGTVVGVAMGQGERNNHPVYVAEVNVLYVLPAFQRRGLGRQLVAAVARHVHEHGLHALLIRVLKVNAPARRFYEALGGQLVLEEQFEEDGVPLVQVAYGWADIRTLLV